MPSRTVLQSWKQISEYVGRTERTLQRWEQEFGFPIHRPSGKSRSAVVALVDEVQEWTRGKPSLVEIRQTARLNRAKLVRHPFRDLLKRLNSRRIEFLQLDLDLALTMAHIAARADNGSEKKNRNMQNARRTFEDVLRLHDKVITTDEQRRELDQKLSELRTALVKLGEHF